MKLRNVSITQIIPMDVVDESSRESCANATWNIFKFARVFTCRRFYTLTR